MATLESGPVKIYNTRERRNGKHVDTDYEKSLEVSKAPDTFECGHVLCHGCIRRFLRSRARPLKCPVCHVHLTVDVPRYVGTSVSYSTADDDAEHVTLLSNYGEVVKKFNGINLNLRRLREESVTTKTMGLSYLNTHCDLCDEYHGTLKVIQEGSRMSVVHERPNKDDPWWFFRLSQSNIVTSFDSQVQSSCICVPCTFKELRETEGFPQIQKITDADMKENPGTCLAEVGKIVAKNEAPIMSLQGKNIVEIEHTMRVRESADLYDFHHTTELIENMVKTQERMLVKFATKQILDTGHLYHIKECNQLEYDLSQTEV